MNSLNEDVIQLCSRHGVSISRLITYLKLIDEDRRIQIPISAYDANIFDKAISVFPSKSKFYISALNYIVENSLTINDRKLLNQITKKDGRERVESIYISDEKDRDTISDFISKNSIKKSVAFRYAAHKFIERMNQDELSI